MNGLGGRNYIVAPPDSRVVGTADATAITRPRTVGGLASDASEIVDTGPNSPSFAEAKVVAVVMGKRGTFLQGSTVVGCKLRGCELVAGKDVALEYLASAGVDSEELQPNFLHGAVELDGGSCSSCFWIKLPLDGHNAVSFDGALCGLCLQRKEGC